MTEDFCEEAELAGKTPAAVDKHGRQQAHGVATRWIANRFDVGVWFRVNGRSDRNTFGVVDTNALCGRTEDCLRIGTSRVSDAGRKVGQGPSLAQLQE